MSNRIRKAYIDSAMRTSGTSTAFDFQLPESIECSPGPVHCAISSVVIPNSLFSVMSNVNDKIYVYQRHATESSSINSIVTIPAGQYSATALNVAIQVGLTAVALGSATYACNYSSVSQRITITQTSGSGFLIYDDYTLKTLGRKDPSNAGFYGTLPKIPNPQSLNQTLNTPLAGNPDVVFVSGVIILARVRCAYLRSPDLSSMNTLDSSGRRDVMKRIPLTSDFGTLVVGSDSIESSDWMDISGRTLERISFKLTDSHGNTLDLHNHDISFCLNFLWGE